MNWDALPTEIVVQIMMMRAWLMQLDAIEQSNNQFLEYYDDSGYWE